MAHKKGGGSSRNGRDSKPKMLGVKVFGGQVVPAGSIIVRQRGTRFRPADGTGIGRDHTIFATVTGRVRVHQRPQGPPDLRARRGAGRRLATPGGAGEGHALHRQSADQRRGRPRRQRLPVVPARAEDPEGRPRRRQRRPGRRRRARRRRPGDRPVALPPRRAPPGRRTAATARARCATAAAATTSWCPVPPGTRVLRDGHVIAELAAPGDRVPVARGGDGGVGNRAFRSSTRQAPRNTTPGTAGEEAWLTLELRLPVDVGIVGLPNAGKSALLVALTGAAATVAPYPQSTREPAFGPLEDEDAQPLPGRRPARPRRRRHPAARRPPGAARARPRGAARRGRRRPRRRRMSASRWSARPSRPTWAAAPRRSWWPPAPTRASRSPAPTSPSTPSPAAGVDALRDRRDRRPARRLTWPSSS